MVKLATARMEEVGRNDIGFRVSMIAAMSSMEAMSAGLNKYKVWSVDDENSLHCHVFGLQCRNKISTESVRLNSKP